MSTLRFLRTSLRTPYLPYLVRIALFTLAAKLVRVLAPPLLHFVARLSSWLWTALTAVVRFAAWSGMWLGLAALALWLVVGAGGALVFVARRALGARAGKVVVVVYAGWEAWAFFGGSGGRRAVPPVAVEPVTASSSAARSTEAESGEREEGVGVGAGAHDAAGSGAAEEGVDDEELERWARQAKESLLRDSLLRQGRKAGGGGARGDTEADVEAGGFEDEDEGEDERAGTSSR